MKLGDGEGEESEHMFRVDGEEPKHDPSYQLSTITNYFIMNGKTAPIELNRCVTVRISLS